jgi:hypothetical protein
MPAARRSCALQKLRFACDRPPQFAGQRLDRREFPACKIGFRRAGILKDGAWILEPVRVISTLERRLEDARAINKALREGHE